MAGPKEPLWWDRDFRGVCQFRLLPELPNSAPEPLDSEAIIEMDKRYFAPEHEITRQNRSFPLTPGNFQAPWNVPSRHSRNW